jgi:hypothetical protein
VTDKQWGLWILRYTGPDQPAPTVQVMMQSLMDRASGCISYRAESMFCVVIAGYGKASFLSSSEAGKALIIEPSSGSGQRSASDV